MITRPFWAPLLFAFAACGLAQDTVTIQVDGTQNAGANKPVWTYFGYDEPNYTTAQNGRKLVRELSDLSANSCLDPRS